MYHEIIASITNQYEGLEINEGKPCGYRVNSTSLCNILEKI